MSELIITERSNMVALANIARNKTGQTKELTFGEIFDTFENAEIAKNQDITITENGTYTPAGSFTGFGSVKVEVESSGGSMFTSTAVGIIPDVPKGFANSTLTIDFESSAIGSLT